MTLLAAEKPLVSPKSGKEDGCTRERNIKKWSKRWGDYWYEGSVLQHLFPGAKQKEGSATSSFFFRSKKNKIPHYVAVFLQKYCISGQLIACLPKAVVEWEFCSCTSSLVLYLLLLNYYWRKLEHPE